MNVISLIGRCMNSVRSNGLLTTIMRYRVRVRARVYEHYLGIQSEQIISLKEIGLEDDERREYYPTGFDDFRRMRKFLLPETSDEVFIDYGAGLGRVLVLAGMLPFKRVIGIELSPELAVRARANLSRCKERLKCKNIEILSIDATRFEVPTDATTFYFNNPFAGTILTKVLDNIRHSHRKRPRALKIVCNCPQKSAFGDQICGDRDFRLQQEFQLNEGRRCLVFSMNNCI